MKRTMLAIFLSLASSIGHAGLGYPSIARLQPETFRPGWPPDLHTLLEDWGLRGPVKCVRSAKEGDEEQSETLCFDRQGRLSTATLEESHDASRIDFTYHGRQLKQMRRRLESGDAATTVFEYDASGHLVRSLQTSTSQGEPSQEQLTFQYDSNGFIARSRCQRVSSDVPCVEDESEYRVDRRGRPLKIVIPDGASMMASFDRNSAAMPKMQLEAEFKYDDRLRSAVRSNYLDGRVLAEIAMITDESGDVTVEMKQGSEGVNAIRYRYTYDSYRNWTRRDASDMTRGPTPAMVRELTYWDR